jgi:hypothetical protein
VTFVHTAITWLTSLLHLPTKCMHHVVMKRCPCGNIIRPSTHCM